jgi:uncharacterized protein
MFEVRDGRFGKGIYATEVIDVGQVVQTGRGQFVPARTRHSIQVDHDAHVVINSPIELINHSCEPNCGLLVRRGSSTLEIHALTRIEPGQELTSDYCSFELEILFMPDPCGCGAPTCRGRVTGYNDLSDEQKAAYGPYVAEYLRDLDSAEVTRRVRAIRAETYARG